MFRKDFKFPLKTVNCEGEGGDRAPHVNDPIMMDYGRFNGPLITIPSSKLISGSDKPSDQVPRMRPAYKLEKEMDRLCTKS